MATADSYTTHTNGQDDRLRVPYHSNEDDYMYRSTLQVLQHGVSSEDFNFIITGDQDSVTSLPYTINNMADMEYNRQSCPSSNLQFHPVRLKKKSVCMTYVLTLFLGIVGAHHFYLGRPKFGTLYVFTAGLLGLGYVVDLVRVPWLVENANLELLHPELRGRKYIMDAYLLWLPPFGLLGFHHFYLGNTCNALVYLVTFGALVIGWLLDVCFVPLIWMNKANANYHHIIATINNDSSGMPEMPDGLMSRDCAIVTSPDVFFTSPDGGGSHSSIMLNPPPYSEVDELAEGNYNPPSYSEVLAMDARESET